MLKTAKLEIKRSTSKDETITDLNGFLTNLLKKIGAEINETNQKSIVANSAEKACLLFNESEIEIIKEEINSIHNFKISFLDNVFKTARTKTKESCASLPDIVFTEKWLNENYDIRFNTIANQIEYKNKYDDENSYEEFNEYVVIRNAKHNFVNLNRSSLISIVMSDFTKKHNPIRQYFKDSVWDKHDHIGDLAKYIYVNDYDRERFDRHFRMMFIRTIAGALGESYNKRCMVFVGGQDAGKTYFCNWLCPPALKYFKTDEIDFNSKDGMIALGSNFWIILDELAQLSKSGINIVKSVLSKNNIKVRLPYAHRESMLKRSCSFIANTNDNSFLEDPSGSVRWICFKLKGRGLNRDYSKNIDIDQVWAQAYQALLEEERYDMNQDELKENNEANIQFTQMNIEQEIILEFIRAADENDPDCEFLSASEIIEYITEQKQNLKLNAIAIGKALKKLNFPQEQVYDSDRKFSTKGYNIRKITKK